MNKLRKKFICISMSLLIVCLSLWEWIPVYAAENASLSFTGLEEGDEVEVYKIATYMEESGSYTWFSAVANWMNNGSGEEYKSFTPAKLMSMKDERAKEFFELLLLSMKGDSKGVSFLPMDVLTIDEEHIGFDAIAPGIYLVLPKGKKRVYNFKSIEIRPGLEYEIEYLQEDGDYFEPSIAASVENITQEDLGETPDSLEMSKNLPLIQQDDIAKVSLKMVLPAYPDIYTSGKRKTNLTICVDNGLIVDKESLQISGRNDSEEEYVQATEEDYSLQYFTSTVVYSTKSGEVLFFGNGDINNDLGNFYYPDGTPLTGPASAQDALDLLNTSYVLPQMSDYSIDSVVEEDTEEVIVPEAEPEPLSEEEPTEEEVVVGADDDTLTLDVSYGSTVMVAAVNASFQYTDILVEYQEQKDAYCSDSGIYKNDAILIYSLSPLDTNLMGKLTDSAGLGCYGITIYLCKGDGYSSSHTAEEIIKDMSLRLNSVNFFLYKYEGTSSPGDTTAEQKDAVVDEETGEVSVPPRLVYDRSDDTTYQYEYIKTLKVSDYGIASVCGVIPGRYLVVQSDFVPGYTLAAQAIVIETGDWADAAVMEGNCSMDILWLNYKTRYLPGTGKIGIVPYIILGTLVAIGALMLLINRIYGYSYKFIIAYTIYWVKAHIRKSIRFSKKK